jgi:hypothetical protein
MSQHKYYYKDGEVNVTLGWNRSLSYFFMKIKNKTSCIPIYDDVADANANNAQDTEYYKKILMTLGIPVPEGFWAALEDDKLNNKGNEFTISFAIDDWFAIDHYSYFHQTPATLYIEALEDSHIFQMEYNEVEQLCRDNQKFERYFRLISHKAFAYSQHRILSNLNKTAKERYIEFLGQYPKISQKVPQYALASYLGMSPEFLSKIRRNISQKS